MEGSAQRSSRRWRISRHEIASQVLIPGDQWHPLDNSGAAPEYIPEAWDGPHVGLRLVQAFKTLTAMPNPRDGKAASGYWPDYWPDFQDLLAQEESDLQLKEETANAHNRTRSLPSAQDVSRMESAIIWPARYLNEQTLCILVQKVAIARSREVEMQHVAYRMKLDPVFLRARNRVGLDLIGLGLRRDGVGVF